MTRLAGATGTAQIGGRERHASRSLVRLFVPVGVVAVVLALLPLWLSDSRLLMRLAVVGLVFACYAIAFNIIFGGTGQLFLSMGALAGIGGYGAGLLWNRTGMPVLVAIVLGTLSAALVGGTLSWIAVRRSLGVIFTGIVTLVFSLAFTNLLLGLSNITGGESGLKIQTGSTIFLRQRIFAYYVLVGLVLGYLVVHGLLRRSRVGWAFRALRDDEVAAELAGVDVARYRILGGAIGSAMLGLAGAIYAVQEGSVLPTTYGFGEVDVVVIVMLAFGGIGTLLGPVVGATVFTVLNEWLIQFGRLRLVVYGALIIGLFVWVPRGLIPGAVNVWRRLRGRSVDR
jgi:ABC-type branched-subunit amino acid transport system permease subunit